MDDKESQVEHVHEPKVEDRFGIKMEKSVQSKRTLIIGAVASVLGIGVMLCFKTPEKPTRTHDGINSPQASDVSGANPGVKLDSYSATSENDRLKEQNRKRVVIAKLPGIQKIERRHTGDIPPGSMVTAVLVTGASNGSVRAEVKEPLQIQGEPFVPAGATLLGTGQSTEERLLIHFRKIIFADGTFDNIQAEAADSEDKIVGLHGSKIGSMALKYGAAIGLNFVGGMAEGLQDRQFVGGQVVSTPDAKNALLNGTSRATLDLANDTMSNLKNRAPVIEVPAGKEILVLFDGGQ